MRRQTFIEFQKMLFALLAFCTVTAIFGAVQFIESNSGDNFYDASSDNYSIKNITLVIDAGHGGEDGGAVGTSGVLEKDINLSVAKKLEGMLTLLDVDVVMTRNDDRMLYLPDQSSRKKYYDLRNRKAVAEKYENPVFISIHQNKFPISKYNGLQVYYSDNNDGSKILAENVQSKTAAYLQPDNTRKIKSAGGSIYLMYNLECPAILVECGFLSNSFEENLLQDDVYQKKLAFVIFSAVADYLNNNQSID